MENKVFRKESLDRLKTPEQLDDYIRVTNPGGWLLLTAALFFIIGICIWGIFGRITGTTEVEVISDDTGVHCILSEDIWQQIEEPVTLTVYGGEYIIDPLKAAGEGVKIITIQADLPQGTYTGKVETEAVSPMTFIWN